jgi:1-acyl-sn-glycerol-3-phosphate acyltransferase
MRRFKYYSPIVLQKIGYFTFYFLYKTFVSIEIKGKENLENLQKPVILAANHTSELDVTAIPLVLPFFSTFYPIYFVTNPDEEYKSFGWRSYLYGGRFFNMLGGYPVFLGQKNYAKSLKNHIELLNQKNTICIFPEGKRTLDNHLNPARGGLGYLVYATGATVVPIAIDTFFNMTLTDFFTRQRKVIITILKPIKAAELLASCGTCEPSVDECRGISQQVLEKISCELD